MTDNEDKKTVPVRQDSEDAGAPKSQPPKEAAPARRFKWRLAALVLLVGVIFAGGAMLFPMLQDRMPGLLGAAPERPERPERFGPIEGRLAALESKLPRSSAAVDDLRARVEALENLPPPMETLSGEGLARRTAKLEQDIAALRGAPARSAPGKFGLEGELADEAQRLRADLDALVGRVDSNTVRIEELFVRPPSSGPDTGVAFLMAIGELRRQVEAGTPYTRALDQVANLLATDNGAAEGAVESLSTLAEHAETGAATLQILEASLTPAADAAIAASPFGEEPGWWQQLWGKVSGLVKIRRIGDAPGYEPDAIAARAMQRLEEGDVAGAAVEMKSLEDLAPEAAAWARAAQGHVAAHTALEALERTGFPGSPQDP